MKKRKKDISSVKVHLSKVERWLEGTGASFQRSRSSIIPMLQSAQTALGYLPPEAMAGIARYLRVPTALVQGVSSFYAQFRFQPAGKHKVTVCRGTACHVRGSGRLLDDLTLALKVTPGLTTPDGMFTLETVACFGACALAPVVVIDDKVHRQQSTASLKKEIKTITSGTKRSGARRRRG